jgi:hypothetical protein
VTSAAPGAAPGDQGRALRVMRFGRGLPP